jgi:hypothetical protein
VRRSTIAVLVALALAIGAAPAGASVTLGSLPPFPSGATGASDFVQFTVSSGDGYVVPGNGTITSWSTNAIVGSNEMMTVKVFRKVADPIFYKVVVHDGPRNLASGLLNTFSTSLPVQAGDVLGVNSVNSNSNSIDAAASGDTFGSHFPGLNDGEQAAFPPNTAERINLSALFEPTNTVTVGTTSFNKKKGTATLNLNLPNPGDLTASGKGVKASSAGGAVVSKSVGAGAAQLLIKAKGKQLKTLNQTGKVKLKVAITYTPANGSPGTQSVKVKLKKNL